LEILEKKLNDLHVISLSGRLDAYSSTELERKLNSLIDAGQVKQVISLDKLEYISSSGLRVFLAALKKARSQQGDIKLAGLKPFVKEVFDITGFTQFFDLSDTEEAAVNAFSQSQL